MWWALVAGARLAWTHYLVLGSAVWMIYLADRLADTARAIPGELLSDRHAFHVRYGPRLRCLLGAVCLSLAIATPVLLPPRQFVGGLALLGLTGIYYWMIHHARRHVRKTVPKEALVGGTFSLGTAFFVACVSPRSATLLWSSATLFGLLCFLNCALISSWEQSPQDMDDPASLLNAFPRLTAALCAGALLLTAAALLLACCARSTAPLPIAASALALWALDRHRSILTASALRVLADFVLLTPVVGLCWRLAVR